MNGSVPDLVNVLRLRQNVLDTLDETPKSKAELVESLDVSRSTVNRAVRELRQHDLIEESRRGLVLSPVGESALIAYRRLESRLDSLASWSDVLDYLPRQSGLDPALLNEATFTPAEPHAPDEPIEVITKLISDAEWIRIVSPGVRRRTVDTVCSHVTAGTLKARLVLGSEAIDRVQQSLPERLARAAETKRLTIWESPDPLSYGIVHCSGDGVGEVVLVAVHDSDGFLRGVFETRSSTAVRTATAIWREQKRAAEEVSTDGVDPLSLNPSSDEKASVDSQPER